MLPTVGRVVHYLTVDEYADGRHVPVAAIITAVGEDAHASLTLFFEGEAPEFKGLVPPSSDMNDPQPGTWFWPPRLPADPRPEVPSPTTVDGL